MSLILIAEVVPEIYTFAMNKMFRESLRISFTNFLHKLHTIIYYKFQSIPKPLHIIR